MTPLKAWPMKKLSNIMGQLWEADTNKTLWSLMAKAWSAIRDQIGKENAPLDTFFNIVCPLLNIPAPDFYLEYQGWELGMNEEGSPTVQRDFGTLPASLTNHALEIALSVEDIISYCKAQNYAGNFDYSANTTSPTFIGHTFPATIEKGKSAPQASQAVMSTQTARATMKNMRRARRETARQSKSVSKLHDQIAGAHVTGAENQHLFDFDHSYQVEQNAFYDSFNSLLASQIAQYTGVDMTDSANLTGGTDDVNEIGTTGMTESNDGPEMNDSAELDNAHASDAHLFLSYVPDLPGMADPHDAPEMNDSADLRYAHASDANLFLSKDPELTGITSVIGWNAFRTGANENITLPTFNSAPM